MRNHQNRIEVLSWSYKNFDCWAINTVNEVVQVLIKLVQICLPCFFVFGSCVYSTLFYHVVLRKFQKSLAAYVSMVELEIKECSRSNTVKCW